MPYGEIGMHSTSSGVGKTPRITVDRRRRGKDQTTRTTFGSGPENIDHAKNVYICVGARVEERLADILEGCMVTDDVKGAMFGHGPDEVRVADVLFDQCRANRDVRGGPCDQAIHDHHVVTTVKVCLGNETADEAGAAGDEDAHGI